MFTNRYISHHNLEQIGHIGQQKLLKSSVLILGAGGLGCPVIAYLGGLGIGKIGIIDNDVIEIKNLNRQFIYKEQDKGKFKVDIASKFIEEANSEIEVQVFKERFTSQNANRIMENYDLIIDCCDNVETRLVLDKACSETDKPFVYGAVGDFQGQVSVFNYKKGIRYIHLFQEEKAFSCINTCEETGITGYCCSFAASLQVNEAVKILLNLGNVSEGELITFDLIELALRKFKFFQT